MSDERDLELQKSLEHFRDVCRREGIKLTHQRAMIFRVVAASREHPDAESVCRAVRRHIPTVSLDTVYRTLWLFRDLGLISSLGSPREKVRFDGNPVQHHHFVCEKCGLTQDIYNPEFDKLTIPEDVKELGDVKVTRVELQGLCSRCIQEKRLRKQGRGRQPVGVGNV